MSDLKVPGLGCPPVEVIVGTYEEHLVGYRLKTSPNGRYEWDQSFTNHAHSGSIRSLASCEEFVASGGADEVVRILSLKKRTDVGTLIEQQGTINCMQFYQNSHLFTGSDDGTICVWDTRKWECLKTLRGHKGPVNALSVHPSAKMLLSVSKDKTLRTWNLVKGRCAYITNLKVVADLVQWVPDGVHFVVCVDKRLDVYDISIGGVIHSIDFKKRINSIAFISDSMLMIAGDSEIIECHDIVKKCALNRFKAHDNRVKSVFSTFSSQTTGESEKIWLFSLSSDSHLKLWEINMNEMNRDPILLASVDTTCRPTCFSVRAPSGSTEALSKPEDLKRKKKKQPKETTSKRLK